MTTAGSGRAKVLLYGTLPGDTTDQLAAAVDLLNVADFGPLPAPLRKTVPEIRGIALGMVVGHTPVDDAFFTSFPGLEIFSNFGVGYEHIDARAAAARGIVVTNTPGVLTEEVANTAMGLLIATARQFPQADRFVRAGNWARGEFPLTTSLLDRRLGILGLGRIGTAVAQRASAFGLEISYHGRQRQPNAPYRYFSSLIEMASHVDILMICAPGGPETEALVDRDVLAALGSNGILINQGRGSIVDQNALIAALRERAILTAGLDVFPDEPHVSPELIAIDRIVLLPHLGSGSVRTRVAMAQLCVDNLISWFSGRGPLTPVPETPFARRVS